MSRTHAYAAFLDRALAALPRLRFQYDLFISYRRDEATRYATTLAERLRSAGYRCFLDAEELPPGHRLSHSLKRAIHRSSAFALIWSRRALESEYVRLEVEEFARTGRLLLPIEIGDSIATAPSDPIVDRDLIRIPETAERFDAGIPSLRVTDDIDRSFRGIRVRTRRLLETSVLALVVLAIVIGIAYVLNERVLERQAELNKVNAELERKNNELEAATSSLRKAQDDATAAATIASSRSLLIKAQEAWDKHDPDAAIAMALQATETDPSSREAENTLAGWVYAPGTRRLISLAGSADVSSLAFSADGVRALSGMSDGTVTLWDVAMAKPLKVLKGHTLMVEHVAFNPKGSMVLAGSRSGSVIAWNVSTGRMLHEWKPTSRERYGGSNAILGLVATRDGTAALAALRSGSVCRFNVVTLEPATCRRFPDILNGATALALGPGGDVAAVAADLRKVGPAVILWNARTFEEIRRWPVEGTVNEIAFEPDGRALIAGHRGSEITRFNLEGRADRTWKYPVNDWALRPDGRTALGASSNGSLVELDLRTGVTHELWGHQAAVNAVAYGSDRWTAISASRDGTLRLWDLTNGTVKHRLPGTPPIALSRTGNIAASGSGAWNLENGQQVGQALRASCETPDFTSRLNALALSPAGNELLSGWFVVGQSGRWNGMGHCSVILSDLRTGATLERFEGGHDVWTVAFSASGQEVLSASSAGLSTVNRKTKKATRTEIGAFSVLASSGDGRFAAGGSDGSVRIFAEGKVVQSFTGHGAGASAVAFSPDGAQLLTGYLNGESRLFDLRSRAERRAWKGHAAPVISVAISRNGRLGLLGASDGSVLLTHLEESGIGRIIVVHPVSAKAVGFGMDDQTAVSASDEGITVSRLDSRDDLIRWAKANRHMRR